MKKNNMWIVGALVAVVLFVGVYFLYSYLSSNYTPDNLIENTTAEEKEEYASPDFTVFDSEGNEVNLSDFAGKPVVLNFWVSWCMPCQGEMPHFNKVVQENTDIQFMMVNVTQGDSLAEAKNFIAESGYTFPVFFDLNGEAEAAYSVYSYPRTFFLDEKGNIVTTAVGMLSEERLQNAIALLK